MSQVNQASIKRLLKSLLSLFYVILVWVIFRWFVFEPYVIPSGSMIPALQINDHVFVSKWNFGLRIPLTKKWLFKWGVPQKGDVIVFNSITKPGIVLVKRVRGVPGDTVDGVLLNEDEYFMQGDNTENSLDSRTWGPINSSHFIGKAQVIWLSCKQMLPRVPFVCDPSAISWERMFKGID